MAVASALALWSAEVEQGRDVPGLLSGFPALAPFLVLLERGQAQSLLWPSVTKDNELSVKYFYLPRALKAKKPHFGTGCILLH